MLLRLAMLLALFAGAHSFGHMTHEEHDEVDGVAPTCVDSVDDLGDDLGFCYDWMEDGPSWPFYSYCSAHLLNSAGGMEDSSGVYTPEEMNYLREKCPVACQVEGCV